MVAPEPRATLAAIAPFFIVRAVAPSIAFYREQLGFELDFIAPESVPNPERHEWARWDAFAYTRDHELLAAELEERGVARHAAIADTSDGLRGFEVRDPDGYDLFFGRKRDCGPP